MNEIIYTESILAAAPFLYVTLLIYLVNNFSVSVSHKARKYALIGSQVLLNIIALWLLMGGDLAGLVYTPKVGLFWLIASAWLTPFLFKSKSNLQ